MKCPDWTKQSRRSSRRSNRRSEELCKASRKSRSDRTISRKSSPRSGRQHLCGRRAVRVWPMSIHIASMSHSPWAHPPWSGAGAAYGASSAKASPWVSRCRVSCRFYAGYVCTIVAPGPRETEETLWDRSEGWPLSGHCKMVHNGSFPCFHGKTWKTYVL